MRTPSSRPTPAAAPSRRGTRFPVLASASVALLALTLAPLAAASGPDPAEAAPAGPPAGPSAATGPLDETRAFRPPGAPVTDARLAEDGSNIVLTMPSGGAAFGVEDWLRWARRHLADVVTEPLAIGPVDVGVADFRRFGVAVPSPDGQRVLFSATTYALLTTLSLIGVLDVQDGTIALQPEPRTGDLQHVAWSPNGRRTAYAIGTARAGGEALGIDAWGRAGTPADPRDTAPDTAPHATLAPPADAAPSVTLTRQAMHAAWRAADLPVGEALVPDAYMPRFRDLTWSRDGRRLSFTVDAPGAPHRDAPPAVADRIEEAPPVRWSVAPDGSELRVEEAAPDAAGNANAADRHP